MRGAVRRVGGLEIEDHACQIFERDEDQIAATVPFLIEGLREGNGILYLASAQSSKQVLEFLQGQGMDIQSCLNSGQLVVIGGDQAYQGEGPLDPDRLVSLLRDALESTREKGFFAFRAIFDMNWACFLSSSDKVIEYIIKVDDFIAKNRCLALCQYDRRRFPPKVLEPVIAMHPAVVIGREVFANDRHIPPQTFSHPDANEARLNGIIDSLKRQKHRDDCQRELEKRLLLALDAAGLSIWDWDIAADRVTWSGQLDERLGHVPGSSKHARELLFKMVHPDDRKKVAQAAKRSLEEGADYESEFRLITAEGETRWIFDKGKVIFDQEGKPSRMIGIGRDITEHKQMEQRLQESHEDMRALMNSTRDMISIIDIDGTILEINEYAAKVLGGRPEDLLGKNAFNYHPHKATDHKMFHLDKATQSAQTYRFEDEFNGLYFSHTFYPVKSEQGKTTRIVVVARDITDRKRAEEALRQSEARFKGIFESSPIGLEIFGPDGELIHINRACMDIFGIADTMDISGFSLFDHPTLPAHAKELLLRGETVRYEEAFDFKRVKDLGLYKTSKCEIIYIYVIISPLFLEGYNGPSNYLVQVQDITERKKSEEHLIALENKFSAAFQISPDPLAITDVSSGKIIDINESFEEATGFSKDELIGRTTKELNIWANPQERDDIVRLLSKQEVVIDYPIKMRMKSGDIKDMLFAARFVTIADKRYLLSQAHDITEKKKLEDDLKRRSEQLESKVEERTDQLKKAERLAAIGETAAMIGHDLRNPLQSVYCMIYLARERLKSLKIVPKDGQIGLDDILDSIEESADYMNKIVSDIQDYARTMGLTLVKTDISFFIRDTLSTIKIPDNVHVIVSVDEVVNELSIDLDKMKRIIINLMTNAINAMPDGGSISISVSRKGDLAKISIKDTGVGIPEEVLPKLFLPLFTTRSKGVGLGLSVCKRMVDAMGGKIAINSRVGEGTEAVIEIPVR